MGSLRSVLMLLAGLCAEGAIPGNPLMAADDVSAVTPAPPPPLTGAQLREGVRNALGRAARERELNDGLVRELVAWHEALIADRLLAPSDRQNLAHAVRQRLIFMQQRLRSLPATQSALPATLVALPTPARATPARATASSAPSSVLAQQLPAGNFGPPAANAPATRHQELIDLIQGTVQTRTWEANGGQGVIRYWPLSHAIVVHQSGETHEALQQLLNDLR